jgi:hypothetical protein
MVPLLCHQDEAAAVTPQCGAAAKAEIRVSWSFCGCTGIVHMNAQSNSAATEAAAAAAAARV